MHKKLCSRCHARERTRGNSYCRECDAERKSEGRGKVALPETERGREVRRVVDAAWQLLEAGGAGTAINVRGIQVRSNGDGTVTFRLTSEQLERLREGA